MPIRSAGATGKPEHDELLDCRISMLGLDLQAIADGSRETFNEIIQKCSRCGVREACAVDLKRDPNNPVWETYCPNANALLALAQARWDVPSR